MEEFLGGEAKDSQNIFSAYVCQICDELVTCIYHLRGPPSPQHLPSGRTPRRSRGFMGIVNLPAWFWFCFRIFSQSRRHADQMLGRSPLVPLYAAEQQLYCALGCLSPSHSLQGHAQAEETHFSCLYLWLHSFGYYIKLMTIGEDGNVDLLGLSTSNVLSFCVNCFNSFFFLNVHNFPLFYT